MSENTQKCPSCSESIPLEYSVCPFCGFGLLEYEMKKFAYKPSIKEVFIRVYNFFRHPFPTITEMGVATETKGGNLLILIFSLFLSLRFYFLLVVKTGFDFAFVIDPGAPGKFQITLGFIMFLLSILFLPFTIWLVYKLLYSMGTWFMAKFAAMLGSDLSTKQLRTIVGYSIAPVVIGEFLGIFFTLMGPSGSLGTSASFNAILSFLIAFNSSGAIIAYKFIMIALWLIVLVYTAFGFRITGKMAWVNAFVAATVPIGLFVFFFYILGMFGG